MSENSLFSTDISISVAIDGLDVAPILAGSGLTAALVRCDPRTLQPIPLHREQFHPLVGRTETYVKPNATPNPLGILLKFKNSIVAPFAFERRTYLALALYAGDIDTRTSTPIGMTPPFFLAELLLARRHTRNTEIKWVDTPAQPAPMNPSSKVKVTLIASEVSGGGIDYIRLQFKGEKMRKMDLFSQSDCFYRLRRVYESAAVAPPSVLAKSKNNEATEANRKAMKGSANAHMYNPEEIISEVYQSATIDNSANPEWVATDPILVSALTGPDYSQKCIEFACFDEDTFPKKDDEMGHFRVSLKDLLFAPANPATSAFSLTAPSRSTVNKMKQYGTVHCVMAEKTRIPSAVSLFGSGWRMRLTVAVDFSSLDAGSKSNLHYGADAMDPRRNIIARIISGAGDVMSVYGATTQSTPSLGLTHHSPNSTSSLGSASSPINASPEAIGLYAFGSGVAGAPAPTKAEVAKNGGLLELAAGKSKGLTPSSSLDNLQQAAEHNVSSAVRRYAAAIPSLAAAKGARGFGAMVNTFAKLARESAAHKIYSVVVVIVDDDVASGGDLVGLSDALVAADDAPLSVLFVGVSQASSYKNLSQFEVVSEQTADGAAAAGARARSASTISGEDEDLYSLCAGGAGGGSAVVNHYGGGAPLRHSVDNRRSRRTVAEFNRFFPRMAQLSRHDIAAEILEGVPAHFMQYSALNSIKA